MTWVDNRKISEPVKKKEIKYGKVKRGFSSKFLSGQMKFRAKQKEVRAEKVEELKAIWKSPIFKNNRQRLLYLFKHSNCYHIERGYSIREFANVIYPEKMSANARYRDEELVLKYVRNMFNRFQCEEEEKSEVYLYAGFYKPLGKWLYYNMISDHEAFEHMNLRRAKICLWWKKQADKLNDIANDRRLSERIERRYQEIIKTMEEKDEPEKRKNPLKFKRKRDQGQGTLI